MKLTATEQVPAGASTAPVQVFTSMLKSLGLVPPMLTALMFNVADPVFVTVSVIGVLVKCTCSLLNDKLACEKPTAGVPLVIGSVHRPRPCVHANSSDLSLEKVREYTSVLGSAVPSAVQLGDGLAPPQLVHTLTP